MTIRFAWRALVAAPLAAALALAWPVAALAGGQTQLNGVVYSASPTSTTPAAALVPINYWCATTSPTPSNCSPYLQLWDPNSSAAVTVKPGATSPSAADTALVTTLRDSVTIAGYASTPTVNIGTAPTITVAGTFWQSTQPVSLSSLPALATGANTIGAVKLLDGSGNAVGSTAGNLYVQCANCSGSGVSTADGAAFSAGSSLFAGTGGVYQSTPTANPLTAGKQGFAGLTQYRALFIDWFNSSGAEMGSASAPVQVSLANTGANGTPIAVTAGNTSFGAATSPVATNPISTLTLTSATTAYAAGQLIANNATAGSLTVPSFAIANSAGGALIPRLRLSTNDATSTAWGAQTISVDLWLSAPTFVSGDRAAWSIATGVGNHLATFSCVMSAEYGDGAYAECSPSVGQGALPKLTAGTSVYWTLKATTGSGVTGASKVFTLTAEELN